jgi:hypothetical protein
VAVYTYPNAYRNAVTNGVTIVHANGVTIVHANGLTIGFTVSNASNVPYAPRQTVA